MDLGIIPGGIASQSQGLLQMAAEYGGGAIVQCIKASLDEDRRKSLTEKVGRGEALTGGEAQDLSRLQSEDYQTLKQRETSGEELTGEEKDRLKGYNDRIQAEEAKRAAEEAERKKKEPNPAPGTLPAVASANAGGGEGETHPHTDPVEGVEYPETPEKIKQSSVWQGYDDEGKDIANDFYRLEKEELRLKTSGLEDDSAELVALKEEKQLILDYLKQSGYLGSDNDCYVNHAKPGEQDYYFGQQGLDHFLPEFWFGGGRVVQRTFRAGQWIYQRLTTSKAEASPSGNSLESIKRELQEYLGSGYRTITNKSGDKVFLSKDGTRCVRFDLKNPSPHRNPHMHVEYKTQGGSWKGARVYPRNVAKE